MTRNSPHVAGMTSEPQQASLFDPLPVPRDALPAGLAYEEEFLSQDEERELIELIRSLPLEQARYKSYTARRRVVSFGGSFDYDANRLLPAQPLPAALVPLRDRVAGWMDIAGEGLIHCLVAEYAPGTPLGWHRDVPDFEEIAGVSLGSPATLRFRPWPSATPAKEDIIRLEAAPRSIYRMQGPARWAWQHSVAPTAALRWSITFRTARRPPAPAATP